MKKNPLWLVGVVIGIPMVILTSIMFYKGFIVNTSALFYIAMLPWIFIAIYSVYRINTDMKPKEFNELSDKDKYLDLLENQLELENKIRYIHVLSKRNTEKLQKIGKELFNDKGAIQ